MKSLRILAPVLGMALLTSPVLAQTNPYTKTAATTRKPASRPAPRTVPNTTPAARAADPLRGTNNNGKGQSGYAAPGEPINVQDNGKQTPSYDGPAAGRTTPSKGMTLPRK